MALGYRELASKFTAKNIMLFGIHDGSIDAAQEWVEKEQLPFAILNDPGRVVGLMFGMSDPHTERYVKDSSDGRRPAVVIDEQGVIIAWEPGMNDIAQIGSLLERL